MSKNRLGIFMNIDVSKLNQSDNVINTTGLLNGCEVVLFTSSAYTNAVIMDTSDTTKPNVLKQQPTEDKKDNFIFKLIADKDGKGYFIKSIKGEYYISVNPSTKNIYGSTKPETSWLFTNVGGKNQLTCKLKVETSSSQTYYMMEKNDNIIASTSDGDNQWNVEFTKFGDNAFQRILGDNPSLQKLCCDGKSGKTSICKLEGFDPSSSKCKALAPMPSYMVQMNDLQYMARDDNEEDYIEDDMQELDDYEEADFEETMFEDDDDDEDDMMELDEYDIEENFDISDANINVNNISKNILLSLIIALVIIIIFLGLNEFKFRK